MAKKIVNLGGKQLEAETVGFKVLTEPWCEYECEDGTKLRIKLVISEIVRVENAYTPDGDPVYSVKSNNILATEVPETLRRKPPAGGGKGGNYV